MKFDTDRIGELAGLSGRKRGSGVLSEARQIRGVDSELDPVTESRLRKAIRAELRSVLREVLQEKEEERRNKKNRAAARGPGHLQAFGGPGFM